MEKLFELIIDEEDESGVSMIALVDLQQQEMTTQVVVLESDITTTQENVTAVSELSSF